MITSSGPRCDVCGDYILPVDGVESVNFFRVAQIPDKELCCHNQCRLDVLACEGDWQRLPSGPLRLGYEEAARRQAENFPVFVKETQP